MNISLQLLQISLRRTRPVRTNEFADWMGQLELPFPVLVLVFSIINVFIIYYTIARILRGKIEFGTAAFLLALTVFEFWFLHYAKADMALWFIGSVIPAITLGNAMCNTKDARA